LTYGYAGGGLRIDTTTEYLDAATRAAFGAINKRLDALGPAWLADFQAKAPAHAELERLKGAVDSLRRQLAEAEGKVRDGEARHQAALSGGKGFVESRALLSDALERRDGLRADVATVERLHSAAVQRCRDAYAAHLQKKTAEALAAFQAERKEAARSWLAAAAGPLLDLAALEYAVRTLAGSAGEARPVSRPLPL
jgi:hypothetical protein